MALSDVRWKGMKAIEKMTKILPSKIAGQKLRGAYRKALTPVRNSMRDKIPTSNTGNLWYATDVTINGRTAEDMYGLVGPRRKKGVWNQQGWHAHIFEKGTKAHQIKAVNKQSMKIFSGGRQVGISDVINHPGTKGKKPFSRSIDANWANVANIVSDEVSKIMREEIANIKNQFGKVETL